MDAVEAVARALYERHCAVMFPDEPINWGRGGYAMQVMEWQALARAALSAARPFIAAECAKVALDARDAWAKCGDGLAVQPLPAPPTAIKETIR